MRWPRLWPALCIHLRKGVSKHTHVVYTPERIHNHGGDRGDLYQSTDSQTCTSTLIHTHSVKHSAPGNATFRCPCLVQDRTRGCNQGVKVGNKIRQGGSCLFPTCYLMDCIYYDCIYSPLTSFSPLPEPVPLSLSILKHQLSPQYVQNKSHQHALKYSNSVLSYILVCNRLQRLPFFFFLYGYAAAPPENHLCFISFTCLSLRPPSSRPPWGSERFSRDGRQSTVCSISGREGY